jgi:hypothetical protein
MHEPPQADFAIPDVDALHAETAMPSAPAEPSGPTGKVGAMLERHRDALMAIEGVVMVGEGQDEVGHDAIVVGVKQHHQLATLPKSIEGVRIVGMVIGEVDALGGGGPDSASPRPSRSSKRSTRRLAERD